MLRGSRSRAAGILAVAIAIGVVLSSAPLRAQALSSTASSPPIYSTCVDGGTDGPVIPNNESIAVVKPIFTTTPYSQYAYGSFYAFFHQYANAKGNITTHLDWLRTPVSSGMKDFSGWGATYSLFSFLTTLGKACGFALGRNLHVVTDINVSNGALLDSNNKPAYNAVIIGHEEYVTQSEYDELRLYVAAGGMLIAMSSNQFYGKVTYDPSTRNETFVLGHGGYAFNGKTAWFNLKVSVPWNTSGWFGSSYCCFHKFVYAGGTVNSSNPVGAVFQRFMGTEVATQYRSGEENAVRNLSRTSIIATFLRQSGLTVASYLHQYGKGVVVCLCVLGENTIAYDRTTQFFLIVSFAAGGPEAVASLFPNQPSTFPYQTIAAVGIVLVGVISLWAFKARRSRNKSIDQNGPSDTILKDAAG